jgi:hypothetical protein
VAGRDEHDLTTLDLLAGSPTVETSTNPDRGNDTISPTVETSTNPDRGNDKP